MSRSIRVRVSVELVDANTGQTIGGAPTDTFVQGSRLGDLEAQMARGQFPPLDADSNMVAQTAFNLCRHSYQRLATAIMNRGEAA